MNNDSEGFRALHKTLDDATETLAAIISITRSGETPPDSLMEAADKTVDQMMEWCKTPGNLSRMSAKGRYC